MPVHKIVSDKAHVQLWTESNSPRLDIDILQLLLKHGIHNSKTAAIIKQQLQDAIDVVTPVADLPPEDEAAQNDPGRPDFFWRRVKGKQHLISRSVIVKDVVWDGTRYVPTLLRVREWR